MDEKKDDLVGRHLIVDASTYTRRNLSSTDTVFALFEALNRKCGRIEGTGAGTGTSRS